MTPICIACTRKTKLVHTLSVLVSIHLQTHHVSSKSSTCRNHTSHRTNKQTNKHTKQQLTNLATGDSLHNTPPLLLLLLLRAQAHHLAVVAHGGSGLVHVALEGPVEPAAHQPGRVACHFGVAGASLAVVFAAALVGGQVVEEALGGGGGLRVGVSVDVADAGGSSHVLRMGIVFFSVELQIMPRIQATLNETPDMK